jgi:tRNA acetyltransferase TAN1
MEFNLLATTDQLTISQACSELWMNLRAIGDEDPVVDRSRIKGLIRARTSLDPVNAIRLLRELLEKHPEKFRTIYRILPIQVRIQTTLKLIAEQTQSLAAKIPKDDSFRITLEKRRTELSSKELIEAIASDIHRSVDLENPNWLVLVEIVGRTTGISVVKPEAVLNIQKTKYLLSKSRD